MHIKKNIFENEQFFNREKCFDREQGFDKEQCFDLLYHTIANKYREQGFDKEQCFDKDENFDKKSAVAKRSV